MKKENSQTPEKFSTPNSSTPPPHTASPPPPVFRPSSSAIPPPLPPPGFYGPPRHFPSSSVTPLALPPPPPPPPSVPLLGYHSHTNEASTSTAPPPNTNTRIVIRSTFEPEVFRQINQITLPCTTKEISGRAKKTSKRPKTTKRTQSLPQPPPPTPSSSSTYVPQLIYEPVFPPALTGTTEPSPAWTTSEVASLIEHRTKINRKYIWDNVSNSMMAGGYKRSSHNCKQKWKSLVKVYREIKAGIRPMPQDSDSISQFRAMDDFFNNLVVISDDDEEERKKDESGV